MKKFNYSAVSLQDIQVFIEISKTLNVSLAARRLDISQPTASYSLDKMRQAFGDRLFARVGRKLELTVFGQDLFDYWKPVLDNLETLVHSQDFDPAQCTDTFSIIGGAFELSGPRGGFVSQIVDQAPHAFIQSISPVHENVDEGLHGDFQLYMGPVRPPSAGIVTQSLGSFEIVLYYNKDLVSPPNTLDEFLELPSANLRATSAVPQVIPKLLWDRWKKRRIQKFSYSDFILVAQAVATMPVVATMSTLMSWGHARQLDVSKVPFDTPGIPYELRWSETKAQDQRLIWLREQLLEFIEGAPRTFDQLVADRARQSEQAPTG